MDGLSQSNPRGWGEGGGSFMGGVDALMGAGGSDSRLAHAGGQFWW